MLTKLDGIRALYLELAWEQGEHDTGYGGAIEALGATLAVVEAAAEVFGHEDWVPFCGHILAGDDDDWYAPVLNKIYALEALVTPLLEEVRDERL